MNKLWITYAWVNDEGGDFSFLVQELKAKGVDCTFDKISIIAGRRLWKQIADLILDPKLDGWAILLTKESLESQACQEELAYALDRALHSRGGDFPLLGLVHNVPIDKIPPALKTRLFVNLQDSNWPNIVEAALHGAPPQRDQEEVSIYQWELIRGFRGPNTLAISIKPRFEEIQSWRILFSAGYKQIDWGPGLPQHSGFTGVKFNTYDGFEGELAQGENRIRVITVGANQAIYPGTGCYVVFESPFPPLVGFVPIDLSTNEAVLDKLETVNLEVKPA